MPHWYLMLAEVIGPAVAAFIGVKVGMTRLDTRLGALEREVGVSDDTGLRKQSAIHGRKIVAIERDIQFVTGRVSTLEARGERRV